MPWPGHYKVSGGRAKRREGATTPVDHESTGTESDETTADRVARRRDPQPVAPADPSAPSRSTKREPNAGAQPKARGPDCLPRAGNVRPPDKRSAWWTKPSERCFLGRRIVTNRLRKQRRMSSLNVYFSEKKKEPKKRQKKKRYVFSLGKTTPNPTCYRVLQGGVAL